jgi:acyl-coenzyme A thioesterase PaaI-like protein
VVSRGSRTALAEARLSDARGRLLAHATSTCMVFPIPAPS